MAQLDLSHALPAAALRRLTDPTRLGFETTERLPSPGERAFQERAREAMDLALAIPDGRYNLYVSGQPGAGRTATALAAVRRAAARPRPMRDWVYVHNFERSEEPVALELPAGRAQVFAHDVAAYVAACQRELRRAFTLDVYGQQRAELLRDVVARSAAVMEALKREALQWGIVVRGEASGFSLKALRPDGAGGFTDESLDLEAFEALSDDLRSQVRANYAQAEAALGRTTPQLRAMEEEARGLVRGFDHEVADTAVRHISELIAGAYAAFPAVGAYLQRLRMDVVNHAAVLRGGEPSSGDDEADGDVAVGLPLDDNLRERVSLAQLLRRYGVNVMVSRAAGDPAPVVEETNPTYANLMGRIDMGSHEGVPFTDHMMLRPGAMHKAVGGYLALQARDVVLQHRAWDAVKRVARFGRIELENSSQPSHNAPGATIRPQPIHAEIKVILIGDFLTYIELAELDPEFLQCFKVRADFDDEAPRDAEAERMYAQQAGEAARSLGYPPFTSDAVALLIEEGSRWAGDQDHVSAQFSDVRDLCVEAGYFASQAGSALTQRAHMAQAILARERRLSLGVEKVDEQIAQQHVLISTDGAVVGQINGLTIQRLPGYAFCEPVRITARVAPGVAGVVAVERETQMSGPSHSKGVLTLAGFLMGRFAEEFPLSLNASLSFEQTYDGVTGDSASSAELYALLSALADLPIRQGFAVTGSVNQRGEIQAIGGVTLKVEGWFRTCQRRGLTGDQGVLIPRANARNLMLRDEVVQAVQDGRFHVLVAETVEEGMQLLTGIPFGAKTSDGRYLEGTVAARVLGRLRHFSEIVRRYAHPEA